MLYPTSNLLLKPLTSESVYFNKPTPTAAPNHKSFGSKSSSAADGLKAKHCTNVNVKGIAKENFNIGLINNNKHV